MEDHTQHGAFSWHELLTSEVAAAKDFYTSLLGWDAEDMQMENGTYTIVSVGEEQVGGILAGTAGAGDIGAPTGWGVYITVDDVDATAAKAEELGGRILLPPQDIPGVGRFSSIQDPQGAKFYIIRYASMRE